MLKMTRICLFWAVWVSYIKNNIKSKQACTVSVNQDLSILKSSGGDVFNWNFFFLTNFHLFENQLFDLFFTIGIDFF